MVSNAEKKRKCPRNIPDVSPLGVVGLLDFPARKPSVFGGDVEDDAVEGDDEAAACAFPTLPLDTCIALSAFRTSSCFCRRKSSTTSCGGHGFSS
jgi:hypothetical protein